MEDDILTVSSDHLLPSTKAWISTDRGGLP